MHSIATAIISLLYVTFCSAEQSPLTSSNNDVPSFKDIHKAFKKASIVPDVLDSFSPKCYISPSYSDSRPIFLGAKLSPSLTKSAPSLAITCPDKSTTGPFTVILTDPDAPSKSDPKWSEMCHWIAIIPSYFSSSPGDQIDFEVPVYLPSALGTLGLSELVKYKAPGPPPKTGYHRYVMLLLEGDNKNLTKPEDRQHWGFGEEGHGVRDWAEQEGLNVVGGNFFYERNEKQ